MTLLRLKTVERLVSLSRSEIYRRMKRGDFPAPVRVGPGRIAFVESEIRDWVAALIQQREVQQ